MPGDDILHGKYASLVGHLDRIDTGEVLEHFSGEV